MEVSLIGWYGNDMTHANSAWVSTQTKSESPVRIEKLLTMLAKEGHHTPFEKSMFHFHVTTDIATHIQLLKHRIGVSINAESARYKENKEDRFYVPEDWPSELREKLSSFVSQSHDMYHSVLAELTPTLGRKRAKESARYFKTYASVISCDISFNWRSFIHFYKLRNDDAAQMEIRFLACKMMECIKNIPDNPFCYTIKAFSC